MVSTGKSVFGCSEGPDRLGGGAEDAPSSSSVFITQVPTNTWHGESFWINNLNLEIHLSDIWFYIDKRYNK